MMECIDRQIDGMDALFQVLQRALQNDPEKLREMQRRYMELYATFLVVLDNVGDCWQCPTCNRRFFSTGAELMEHMETCRELYGEL